jgi:lysophospholipase
MRRWGAALPALALAAAAARGITEEGYAERMRAEVLPYFASGATGSFEGEDGVRIAYTVLEARCERGALVVLPGKSESFLKYAELAFDLRESGYSLFLMDHRGMGMSGPLPRDDPGKTHVEHFDDYVADLERFVDQVVDARPHPQRVLLAHSMGGAIALLYVERHPGRFDGAILCAPMLRIDTEPLPAPVARAMGDAAVWLGLGGRYCPGRGPYAREPFERNVFTRDPAPVFDPFQDTISAELSPASRLAANSAGVICPSELCGLTRL